MAERQKTFATDPQDRITTANAVWQYGGATNICSVFRNFKTKNYPKISGSVNDSFFAASIKYL